MGNGVTGSRERHYPLYLGNAREFSWPVAGNRSLLVKPGRLRLEFSILKISEGDEPESRDILKFPILVPDNAGRVWRAETLCDPCALLERISSITPSRPTFESDMMDDDWREALEERPVVTGIRDFLDDRFHRTFIIDDQVLQVPFRYQAPVYDVALLPSRLPLMPPALLVRVSGLYGADAEEIPPFVFETSPEHLIFRNDICFDPTDGIWVRNPIPLPLLFRLDGEGVERNPEVTLVK